MVSGIGLADSSRPIAASDDTRCFACHAAKGLQMRLGQRATSGQDEATRYKGPAHASLSCVQCHPGATRLPHPKPVAAVACTSCHSVAPGHVPARHTPAELGDLKVPTCETCHGHHEMYPVTNPQSTVNRAHIVDQCAQCHTKPLPGSKSPVGPASQYATSVHGRLLKQEGSGRAPVCTDCHGSHPPQGPEAGASPVNYQHIAATCGKCHAKEYEEYSDSAHAQAVAQGISDAPTCTSCHGEHSIQSPRTPGARTSLSRITALCTSCHENQRIVKLYGLPDRRLSTYLQSYHGAANRFGSVKVANCASCHRFHGILPRSDPRSSINPANLATTCGACHPGASQNFARGSVHLEPSPRVSAAVFAVQVLYWLIIGGTLGGFLIYMILDLLAYRRERRLPRTREMELLIHETPPIPRRRLLRMTKNERVQHIALLVSFALLVLTGMALLIPDTSYAQVVVWLCGGVSGRAIVHRVAAVALVSLMVYHVYYVIFVPRGRECFLRGLPTRHDLTELIQTAKYLLGLAKHRACFGRYNFVEKFEYGAVVWGSAVMTVTGAVMMFENFSLRYLPKWAWDMAKAVHGYEAVLAFGAILIWHFYHVLWKPGILPGNRTWIWGYMSPEEFAAEHPLEYAEAVGLLPSETQRILGGYAERLLPQNPTADSEGAATTQPEISTDADASADDDAETE